MDRPIRHSFADATGSEVFSALRDCLPTALVWGLVLGGIGFFTDVGTGDSRWDQFLKDVPAWGWVCVALIVALVFPAMWAAICESIGKQSTEFSYDWRARSFWRRLTMVLYCLAIIVTFAVSALLGYWLIFVIFDHARFSTMPIVSAK